MLSLTDCKAADDEDDRAAQGQLHPDPTVPSTAVLDIDMLLPEIISQSVLLEVSGGGISRTVPR